MTTTNPPPQAYTKETVSQAYQWLFDQPKSVREVASDLDSMVALFLQDKRRRNSAGLSTNPVSAKAFKDELKGLAENFKQFEPPVSEVTTVTTEPAATPQKTPSQPAIASTSSSLTQLDKKSLQSIHTAMESLNLSSESETLRLIISLGYEKLREILPKS